jgi:hypothetical protein
MNTMLKNVYYLLLMLGFDPLKMFYTMKGLPAYFHDFKVFCEQKKTSSNYFPFGRPYPCLVDRYEDSGLAKGHYFHQDLLIARRIKSNNPQRHIDIGSRIDGFVAHVAAFRTIEVLDIRPIQNDIPNVTFKQADLMTPIRADLLESCDSLSCLHALEHFGLGRYGDPVDFNGYLLGLDNLYRMLKSCGKLYLSVPIGPQRIEFNAHRVFSVAYLLELFDKKYKIDHFSFVDDIGNLHENITLKDLNVKENFGCKYGCGIFELTKL